jgi:hypothetical protein
VNFQLLGAGVRLEFTGRWLLFHWGGRWDEYVGSDGRLCVPPERCVSITGRQSAHGSLCLVFRFRPTGVSGGGEVVAEITVGPDQAEPAWQFTEWLAHRYAIEDVSRTRWDAEPHAEREDDQDWLSAPVSPTTTTLFHSVMARLSGTDR